VPKKLLELFAFDDPVTRSKRLWRYQKGRPPYGRASPKHAAAWERHFADPTNSNKEAEIELRLKRDFEDPVNQFLERMRYRTFVLTSTHVRLLAGYMIMLFHRTRARRDASEGQQSNTIQALEALLTDDEKLTQLATKQTMNMIARGDPQIVTKALIVEVIKEHIAEHSTAAEAQATYVRTVETMMAYSTVSLQSGQWSIIHTEPDSPFVIGDAPVVTWERVQWDVLAYGQGFERPNVEVLLPIGPTACLHVLPRVARTRPIHKPTAEEVNMAQAAFATEHCFANVCDANIDATSQPRFGMCRLGIEGFALRNFDYKQIFFDILIRQR
jgi:Protein of unknown function (DUF4238)